MFSNSILRIILDPTFTEGNLPDHLVWLHSIKDPSSRLWKWRTKLAEYEYDIQYKKGNLNNVDALSRNPPLAVVMPLLKDLPTDSDSSSDESLLSFPNEQQPLIQNLTEANNIVITQPRLFTPEYSTLSEIQEPIMEEFNETNDETYLSLDSSSEEDDNDLFLSDYISIGRNDKTNIRLDIIDSRGNLLKQKDNLVIFIY